MLSWYTSSQQCPITAFLLLQQELPLLPSENTHSGRIGFTGGGGGGRRRAAAAPPLALLAGDSLGCCCILYRGDILPLWGVVVSHGETSQWLLYCWPRSGSVASINLTPVVVSPHRTTTSPFPNPARVRENGRLVDSWLFCFGFVVTAFSRGWGVCPSVLCPKCPRNPVEHDWNERKPTLELRCCCRQLQLPWLSLWLVVEGPS